MDALAAATETAAAVSTLGSHFMLDGNTYKRGAELGFQGLDFYIAARAELAELANALHAATSG